MRYVVCAVLVGLAVSACSSGSEVAEPPVVSSAPAPVQSSGTAAGKDQALIAALRRIDPGLVANEDRAVRRARDVCLDIQEGKPAATIAKNAQARFTGGDVTVDADQAAQIVAAAKQSLC